MCLGLLPVEPAQESQHVALTCIRYLPGNGRQRGHKDRVRQCGASDASLAGMGYRGVNAEAGAVSAGAGRMHRGSSGWGKPKPAPWVSAGLAICAMWWQLSTLRCGGANHKGL